MNIEEKIYDYSLSHYNNVYKLTKERMEAEAMDKPHNSVLSDSKKKEIENLAQLEAIKTTMTDGRLLFPDDIPLLWNSIYKAHLYRKSGISDPEVVANAIAAAQSWKAASGHAFEYMTKDLATLALHGTSIRFILQKDLNTLLKANELANEVRDISWLKEQVKTDNFDLYAISDIDDKTYCFGCVQCKTSIRDRVSRDREISSTAMSAYFWSISIVLDGTYLSTPKYRTMVNGGESPFLDNGWHGMYDLSGCYPVDRIYALDVQFDLLRSHAIQAKDAWLKQRQWLDRTWRAK